jgi:protein phosphatase
MRSLTERYGAKSDTGLKRDHNEDRFCADPDLGLYVVCDGMGGHRAGEIASARAVEVISHYVSAAARNPAHPLVGVYRPEFSERTNRLASAVRLANQTIYQEALSCQDYAGMGTTVVSVLLSENVLSIAHVGDSRLYLMRDGSLHPLTSDHSLVAEQIRCGVLDSREATCVAHKHVLTRAVGVAATVDVELGEVPLLCDDLLLLCSDGLTSGVPPSNIVRSLEERVEPQIMSEELIALSNAAGGEDNTTVIVVMLRSSHPTIWQRIRGRLFP